MSCCCYKSVPCLLVTSIAVNETAGTATFTVPANTLPTAGGRFDLRISCGVCINACSTVQVLITDGTTTFTNVLARCGNFLRLGQIACQVKNRYPLHMNATTTPSGNAICLDRLLPAANGTPITSCCTSVTVTPAAAVAAASTTPSSTTTTPSV